VNLDAFADIKLLADPEFPAPMLMNALFSKFHRHLTKFGAGSIGVSFPDSRDPGKSLGARLRLHGNFVDLQRFLATDWLSGMRDHVAIAPPEAVPSGARHRVVRRVQAKSNPERERRRLIARKGISEGEARIAIPDFCAETLTLPFLVLKSGSTKQQFRLFVDHLPLRDDAQQGVFNAYGLSASATVPWF